VKKAVLDWKIKELIGESSEMIVVKDDEEF
jgi:hypothetical protein